MLKVINLGRLTYDSDVDKIIEERFKNLTKEYEHVKFEQAIIHHNNFDSYLIITAD